MAFRTPNWRGRRHTRAHRSALAFTVLREAAGDDERYHKEDADCAGQGKSLLRWEWPENLVVGHRTLLSRTTREGRGTLWIDDTILINFVQKRSIADPKQARGGSTVPGCLVKHQCDRTPLCFSSYALQ